MISQTKRCVAILLIVVALFTMFSVIPTSALDAEETQVDETQVKSVVSDDYVEHQELAGSQTSKNHAQEEDIATTEKSVFQYTILEDGTAEIISYEGSENDVIIPESYRGREVSSISDDAFKNPEEITLYGYRNSIAYDYAKEHSMKFEYLMYDAVEISTCEATAKSKVTISWKAVEDAVSYNIYYKRTDLERDYKLFANTNKTSYIDTLTTDKTYLYVVTACDEDGKEFTEFSEEPYEYTCTNSVPITTLKNTANGILVKWNKVEKASKYRVYYKKDVKNTWKAFTETTDTSIVDSVLTSGNRYYYTVRALDEDGTLISWYESSLPIVALSQPVISNVTNNGTSATISWNKVPGASKYKVFYRRNYQTSWRVLTTTTSTSCVDSVLTNNITYCYTVQAINSDSNYFSSKDEKGYEFKFLSIPKLKSAETSGAEGRVKIKWSDVEGAEKYVVYYKRTDKSDSWKRVGVTSDNYIYDTGCIANKVYVYTVRCISEDESTFTSSYNKSGIKYSYNAAPKLNKVVQMSAQGSVAKARLTWNAVPGVSRYRVYYKRTAPDGTVVGWKIDGITSKTMYYCMNLKDGYKYTFTVRCIDNDGNNISSYDPVGVSYKYNSKTDKNKTQYLDTIWNADPYYTSYPIALSDYDRYYAEHILMGEAGNMDYIGIALVCQSLRDAYVTKGYSSISETISSMGYVAPLYKEPSQEVKDVVRFIFDEGGAAVEHRVMVFYARNICSSGWHESQNFIYQSGYVRFFDMWI